MSISALSNQYSMFAFQNPASLTLTDSSVPPNVEFEIDDLEEPWTFNKKFDFIYARMMTGSFSDWPRFFEQSYE